MIAHRLIVAVILLGLAAGAGAADIATVSHGERVDLNGATVAGKYTLFDFYADWCGPCRSLTPRLEALAEAHPDRLALRKVDVVDWQSAVARQFRLRSIPHLKLYDPEGRLLSEGNAPAVLAALDRALGGGTVTRGRTASSTSSAVPFLALVLVIAIASALIFLKGKRPPASTGGSLLPPAPAPEPGRPSTAPDAVWFVMLQGSLDGPFTVEQLADLKRRRCLDATSQVRRKGDREWRPLDSIL